MFRRKNAKYSTDMNFDFTIGVVHSFLFGSQLVLQPRPYEESDPGEDEELPKPVYHNKRRKSQSHLTYIPTEIPFQPKHEEKRTYL